MGSITWSQSVGSLNFLLMILWTSVTLFSYKCPNHVGLPLLMFLNLFDSPFSKLMFSFNSRWNPQCNLATFYPDWPQKGTLLEEFEKSTSLKVCWEWQFYLDRDASMSSHFCIPDSFETVKWIYLWAFYSDPLIYISVFVPIPYCLDDCGFVV